MKVKYKIDYNSKTKNRTKKNSKVRFRTLHNFWDDKKSFFRVYQDDLKSTTSQKLKITKIRKLIFHSFKNFAQQLREKIENCYFLEQNIFFIISLCSLCSLPCSPYIMFYVYNIEHYIMLNSYNALHLLSLYNAYIYIYVYITLIFTLYNALHSLVADRCLSTLLQTVPATAKLQLQFMYLIKKIIVNKDM